MSNKAEIPSAAMRQRLRIWSVVGVVIGLYGWLVFITTFQYPGKIGLNWNTPGTDWMVYYQGARDFVAGKFIESFNPELFDKELSDRFQNYLSTPLGFRPWVYPPSFLFFITPFSYLPFRVSYFLFLIVTFGVMVIAALSLLPRQSNRRFAVGSLALNPATSITVVQGQNSFLNAGLLVSGIALRETKPIIAGVLFGLLSYKPQLCLMIPIALIAEKRWKVLGVTAATAILLIAMSIGVGGIAPWRAWLDLAIAPPAGFMENFIGTTLLYGISAYADCLLLGFSNALSLTVQIALICIVGYCVFRTFRGTSSDLVHKAGVLLPASILAAPYVALYDLLPLAISATFLMMKSVNQDAGGELTFILGAAAWAIPILNPPVVNALGFLTPFLLLGVMLSFMWLGRIQPLGNR